MNLDDVKPGNTITVLMYSKLPMGIHKLPVTDVDKYDITSNSLKFNKYSSNCMNGVGYIVSVEEDTIEQPITITNKWVNTHKITYYERHHSYVINEYLLEICKYDNKWYMKWINGPKEVDEVELSSNSVTCAKTEAIQLFKQQLRLLINKYSNTIETLSKDKEF